MEKGLLEKTGKSLEHWKNVVLSSGIEKHSEIVKYLKTEHGFTHGYANFVALKARQSDAASHSEDDLLKNQYQGKESLLTLYNRILEMVNEFGKDVEVVPKKANVSIKRKKQFALIQPSTKTRIDLGLKLKGVPNSGRLEGSGPFGSMCTHRIKLQEPDEINDELRDWLQRAYDAAD